MALATINIAFRGDINGVELDEVRRGTVGWDSENLEVGLAYVWFRDQLIVVLRIGKVRVP